MFKEWMQRRALRQLAMERRTALLIEGAAIAESMESLRRRGAEIPAEWNERFDAVLSELELLR
jgi:hypothetical protein